MTINEVAEYLCVDKNYAYRLLKSAQVNYVRSNEKRHVRDYDEGEVKKLRESLISGALRKKYEWTEKGLKQRRESMRRYWASLTPEQRAERGKKQIAAMVKYWQNHEIVTK